MTIYLIEFKQKLNQKLKVIHINRNDLNLCRTMSYI